MLRLFEPRERREAYALLPAIIFVALVETAGVASIAPFLALVASPSSVDTIPLLKNVYDALGFTSEQAFLIFVGSASLVAIIVSNAFSALVRYLIYRFAYLQSHRLQNRLLRHYMSQPYAAFLGRNSSELGKNIIIEVSEAVNRVLLPLLQGASKLFAVTAIIVLLVIVNPLLALTVAVALGGTYALIYAGMRKRLQRTGDERVALERIRYQTMAEGFGGLKEVQAGGHERHILEAFFLPSLRHARITIAQRTIGAMPKYLLEVVAFQRRLLPDLRLCLLLGQLLPDLPNLVFQRLLQPIGWRSLRVRVESLLDSFTVLAEFLVEPFAEDSVLAERLVDVLPERAFVAEVAVHDAGQLAVVPELLLKVILHIVDLPFDHLLHRFELAPDVLEIL